MMQRYAVVLDKGAKRSAVWEERTVRTFRTLSAAERYAHTFADKHVQNTLRGRRERVEVRVVDVKRGRTLVECQGRIVPSVGELGYW